MALESSFCMTASYIMQLRSFGVMSFVGTAGKVDVARAVQSLTAINLQAIRYILSENLCSAY